MGSDGLVDKERTCDRRVAGSSPRKCHRWLATFHCVLCFGVSLMTNFILKCSIPF